MKKECENTINADAIAAYQKYITTGKQTNLPAKESKSILKFILLLLATGEKMTIYNTGPKAIAQLNKFALDSDNKISWETEREKHVLSVPTAQSGQL